MKQKCKGEKAHAVDVLVHADSLPVDGEMHIAIVKHNKVFALVAHVTCTFRAVQVVSAFLYVIEKVL
jgi:hypothetical protein